MLVIDLSWTESKADINGVQVKTRTVKITLDQRLYARLVLRKTSDEEGMSEVVAKAVCRYLGIDEKDYTIPSLKDAKARSAESFRKRTDLGKQHVRQQQLSTKIREEKS